MRLRSTLRLTSSVFVCFAWLCLSAPGADWPTYLHDNARTGATDEQLAAPLAEQWIRAAAHAPELAWSETPGARDGVHPMTPRVNFDTAFHVAVVGNVLYYGSSDGKVFAADARTGQDLWRFFTEGPVRLAPTIAEGKVYFGSDDGCVYCVNAADGNLVWKHRVAPRDERVIGSGHIISRWPVRTGVLVDNGIAYFGAGIFPHETVYLAAARASDGTILWVNDAMSQQDGGRNEFSPQGYLLASTAELFVPSGRNLPAAFRRDTGALIYQKHYGFRDTESGGVTGGTYALLADGQIFTGATHLLAIDQKNGATGFGWLQCHRMAVSGDKTYIANGTKVAAVQRKSLAAANFEEAKLSAPEKAAEKKAKKQEKKGKEPAPQPKQKGKATEFVEAAKKQAAEKKQMATAWNAPSKCDAALIVAGALVFAGGDKQVVAFDAASGKQVWTANVDGVAYGLAVADGHLFVSTDRGTIYCFASANAPDKTAASTKIAATTGADPFPKDDLTPMYEAAASAILKHTGVTKGFCLVLGAENGRLAYELAKRTELQVYGIEPDAAKVDSARRALDAAGLCGSRVFIDRGDPKAFPYSDYFANLIVSDALLLTGQIPGAPTDVARLLKPCGGVVCLGAPRASSAAKGMSAGSLRQWVGGMGLGEVSVTEDEAGAWATLTRGALPGAGAWTHQYAEPGNTACSDDQLVKGALGVLWYGDPGPTLMADRHAGAPAPLAINGRLIVQGWDDLMAYDAYNGVRLWQRDNRGAIRLQQKKVETGNLAASEDSVFVVNGDRCDRIDQATGKALAAYKVPASNDGKQRPWGYLACVDGRIYGSTLNEQKGQSNAVFAIDVKSGKTLWRYQGKNIGELTIAIGDGRVFFIDSALSLDQRDAMLREDKTSLKKLAGEAAKKAEKVQKEKDLRLAIALDAATGKKAWETPVDVTYCSEAGIGGGSLVGMVHDGVVVLGGANGNGHYWTQFLNGEFSQRRLVALSAKDGQVLWAKDANYRSRPLIVEQTVVAEPWGYDLRTGAQKKRVNPVTGGEANWVMMRTGHHCGIISGCPNTLFFRSAYAGYYDLADDSGVRHFAGLRLGCWINAIPANGLALMPEAAAGCNCLFSIVGSVALEPRPIAPAWSIYGIADATKPVQRLAVNLGGPGDRRDAKGNIWFGYPRPAPGKTKPLGVQLSLQQQFLPQGGFFSFNSESGKVEGTDAPWLFASGVCGLKQCVLPLTDGKQISPYTVRLYFADLDNTQPGQRVFDVKIQGKTVLPNFDIVKEAGGPRTALVREIEDVAVQGDLVVELVPKTPAAKSAQAPLLNAIEAVRSGKTVVQAF